MKNLSVLTIPIATPPETSPPPGQVYVFFNTDDQLQIMGSDGMVEPLHLRKHTQQVTLTDSFNIIGVPSNGGDVLILEGDLTDRIKVWTVLLIADASIATNQQIRIVRKVELNSEGNTELTIRRGNLPTSLVENESKVHISKQVTVEHFLGSKAITFSMRSVETGETVDAANVVPDENNLVLMPSSPSLGEFLVTIVA